MRGDQIRATSPDFAYFDLREEKPLIWDKNRTSELMGFEKCRITNTINFSAGDNSRTIATQSHTVNFHGRN